MKNSFAYCVFSTISNKLILETMRFSKRESIKAYLSLTFPNSKIEWKDCSKVKCCKIELNILTQNKDL